MAGLLSLAPFQARLDGLIDKTLPPRLYLVMGIDRRTHTLMAVLRVLSDNKDDDHYGLDLARKARINPGSVYPILIRLELEGWLTSHWEDIDESAEGRRRRKYYRLTSLGCRPR
jgi:PadR family transcriptional regulator, regulatory protein PadR